MSAITVSGFQPSISWPYPGTTATLRYQYTANFVDSTNTKVLRDLYKDIPCTVTAGIISVPTHTIISTLDALVNPLVTLNAQFIDERGTKRAWLFQNFQVPTTTPTTEGALEIFNQGNSLVLPPVSYLTATGVQSLINIALGLLNKASSVIYGILRLSLAPVSAVDPIAVGDNDLRVTADQAANVASIRTLGTGALQAAPGDVTRLSNTRLAVTFGSNVANADKGKTFALGGAANYVLAFLAPSGYDTDFMALVVNEDTAQAKIVSVTGSPFFTLYPGQSAIVYNQNNVWRYIKELRWKCPSGTTLYVNPGGSDALDGLSAPAALRTVQAAINKIKQDFDLSNTGGTPVVIQLADGTYTDAANPIAFANGPFVGYQPTSLTFPGANEVPVLIQGNLVTPTNVLLNTTGGVLGTVLCLLGAVIGVTGVEIRGSLYGLQCGAGAIIVGNVKLGACGTAKVYTTHSGVVEFYGTNSVDGNSSYVFWSDFLSAILISGTINLTGNMTGAAFANSTRGSSVDFNSVTINLGGFNFTGRKFSTASNGVVNTGTSNLNFLPGTVAGINNGFGAYDSLLNVIFPTSGTMNIQGTGLGAVTLGEWGFSNAYGAVSFNGSTAAGDYNLAGHNNKATDPNLYFNRPTGGDLVVRENNVSAPSQIMLKNTTGYLGLGVNAPKSGIHPLLANIPVFATNALALAGGLTAGAFYRSGGDPDVLSIVH